MTASSRPPVTDSAWFWALAFSLLALLALAAIGGKYGRRQAKEERKYQAAQRIAVGEEGAAASSNATGRRPYSMPDQTLIPLWPLALVMSAIALVAAVMLYRSRGLRQAQPSRGSGSPESGVLP